MKYLGIIVLLCSAVGLKASESALSCLPANVSQETLVSGRESAGKLVTVREALRKINARCQGGKVVDQTGREVHFFHLVGCWGNPPQNYQEVLAAQAREVESLKTRYTVFEVPCATGNPRAIQ